MGVVVCALTLGPGAATEPSTSPCRRRDRLPPQHANALVDDLPDAVQEGERRPTSPESDLTAAWGDPVIVLRCGVSSPAAYDPTAQLVEVNGVEWFPEELEHGYRFTTFGRSAFVEVTVPDRYRRR